MRSNPRIAQPRLTLAGHAVGIAIVLAGLGAAAPEVGEPRGSRKGGPVGEFKLAVPEHPFDVILVRPERNAVTLSVLAYQELDGMIVYGTQPGAYARETPVQPCAKGTPTEWVLDSLQAGTRYYYQFRSRAPGSEKFSNAAEESFQTARAPGGSFTFTMTADAHLDEHTSAAVYGQTLDNIRADRPDFHIDLGNLFMTDKHATREEAARQYLAERYYLGRIGGSVPILLALGTHDGESGRYYDGSAEPLAVWSNRIRKRYFPNPVPDAFYTGNTVPKPPSGLLQNYYAWEWGDALFVVLDPFANTVPQRNGNDGWAWTLGQAQYRWLDATLGHSRAKFKFVFIHNLLSGDQASRGGVEIAGYGEWGGRNQDGTDGFKQHRPGWELPVHPLLLRHHVAAVFKAHDNFYARQELDGILYLMVPQPSFAGNDRIRDLEAYGYKHGTFLGNSGHVRVTVTPEKAVAAYVKSSPDRTVADSCVIPPR